MNPFLQVILLSMTPISELRGGIPLGIALHLNPWYVFLTAVISNILIIPIFLFFLDYLHKHFLSIKIYQRIFTKAIEHTRKKIEHKIGTRWEMLFLYFFVAVPLPGTGAYAGSLLAWFFNLKRKQAFISISLGVITAGIIITLLSLGILSFFS